MAQLWWLNLIIKLATVSVIHVQKIVKIKITMQKIWRESYWPLFVDTVYIKIYWESYYKWCLDTGVCDILQLISQVLIKYTYMLTQ